jgi:hypothetical protein
MSDWFKYMHVERLDSQEVEGLLEMPEIFVEPKIDGANASIHVDNNGKLRAAKRTQVLGDGHDFRGLTVYLEVHKERFLKFFEKYPNTIIYGEWLVKHTINYYREGSWNKFYAFDILDLNTGNFIRPDKRVEMLREFEIEMVVPICKINGPIVSKDIIQKYVDQNKFLIDEPDKIGEGVVFKAFNGDQPYRNRFARTTWGKVVRQEFKEKNYVAMGMPEIELPQLKEKLFAETFITPGRVEKCKQKICDDRGTGWDSKYIGDLLRVVYRDAFEEELWSFVKEEKVQALDFKMLGTLCVLRAKRILGL